MGMALKMSRFGWSRHSCHNEFTGEQVSFTVCYYTKAIALDSGIATSIQMRFNSRHHLKSLKNSRVCRLHLISLRC